jgi:hypothetical protein
MIKEAVYKGNLGFMEFAAFKKVATDDQKKKFDILLKNKKYDQLKKLIKSVLNIELDDSFYKK